MWGRATLMTVTSSTIITVTVMPVTVIAHRRRALMGASISGVAVVSVVSVVIASPLRGSQRRRHLMGRLALRRSCQSARETSIRAFYLTSPEDSGTIGPHGPERVVRA